MMEWFYAKYGPNPESKNQQIPMKNIKHILDKNALLCRVWRFLLDNFDVILKKMNVEVYFIIFYHLCFVKYMQYGFVYYIDDLFIIHRYFIVFGSMFHAYLMDITSIIDIGFDKISISFTVFCAQWYVVFYDIFSSFIIQEKL